MIRKMNVETPQGSILESVIFKSQQAKTVIIVITGVEGNIQNNPFYTAIGKKLSSEGIDFVVAHTKDAFNQTKSINQITAQTEIFGASAESFADSDNDVQAYLNWALSKKYQHIILGGQSLGANKVIHYLATHSNVPIDKFLLLSPVDIDVLRRSVSQEQREYISEQKESSKGKNRLPFKLFRWLSCDVDTADEWLFDDTLNNVHFKKNMDFSQVERIYASGALIIGTRDRFAGGDPSGYLKNINNHFKTKARNELVFIKDTGHIYRGKEYVLANEILNLINKWKY
ncbi:alpha/beta hydrolase [Companilactobacillus crustorum]|uniref:alpha/beta hydrolase n=1 Tax=Companilactobacillus crustorum TaxID=392416 RepID=UPI000957A44B|nr:alpha/beta hydrolase [Companilactobacillus crustorum]APU71944.1 hypothetical protein BI355_1639 [Companilactobacillus crustorum]